MNEVTRSVINNEIARLNERARWASEVVTDLQGQLDGCLNELRFNKGRGPHVMRPLHTGKFFDPTKGSPTRTKCDGCSSRHALAEVDGVVLCASCRALRRREPSHGTMPRYRDGCRCDKCKARHERYLVYLRDYQRKRTKSA